MRTSIFIIALVCLSSVIAVEMETEAKVQIAPELLLQSIQNTNWGSLAINMLQMQLETNGPLEELIVAFRNLYNNLAFKMNQEDQDYVVMRGEHLIIYREAQERDSESAVRMGVSNQKLISTLYPDQATYEQVIASAESLIESTQATIDHDTEQRAQSQAIYETNFEEVTDGINAIKECISLIKGLQSGIPTLAQVSNVQKSTKNLVNKIPDRSHNPSLVMIKTLFKMVQDYADAEATQRVLDLFYELLDNYVEESENLTRINKQEIMLFEQTLAANQQVIKEAEVQLANAQHNLEQTNRAIEEEEGRLATAQDDNAQALLDISAETNRWDIETQAHLDLKAQLESEMQALNQVIDLFSNPDIEVSSDMINKLNQSG